MAPSWMLAGAVALPWVAWLAWRRSSRGAGRTPIKLTAAATAASVLAFGLFLWTWGLPVGAVVVATALAALCASLGCWCNEVADEINASEWSMHVSRPEVYHVTPKGSVKVAQA